MKIGVIGVPGGWSSEKMADTVCNKTGYRLLIDMEQVFWSSEKESVFFQDTDLSELDAIIIKKIGSRYSPHLLDRLYILDYLNKKGVKFFSKPPSIIKALDRLSCTLELQSAKIPMPSMVVTEKIDEAVKAVFSFKEAVLKPLFSSKARGMSIVTADMEDLEEKLKDFKNAKNKTMYIQKKIDISGRDLGLVFLGGEYIATYARVGDGTSWNTTTNNGGRYAPYEPDERIIKIAAEAQNIFSLDYTVVDIAETADGPFVFEVSAFGGFRGLMEAYNIDAAEKFLTYVMERLR